MDDRVLDYIKELEIRLVNSGQELPSWREEIKDQLIEKDDPLLVIKLDDLYEMPFVKYKGEAIQFRDSIEFSWKQKSDELIENRCSFLIKHWMNRSKKGMPIQTTIGESGLET